MNRWVGKVALITGASAGIGAQITRELAKHGLKVIPVARRLDKLEELAASIKCEHEAEIYPMTCDMLKEEDILKIFKWADAELGGIDVLINNAGVVTPKYIIESTTEEYHKIMNVNVVAAAICSREFAESIKKHKKSGHIININSISGHYPQIITVPVSVYSASKCALTGLTQTLRNEFIIAKLDIKITSISPGLVETDMVHTPRISPMIKNLPMLQDTDIADTVIYALSVPKRVEICEVIIMPQAQDFKLL